MRPLVNCAGSAESGDTTNIFVPQKRKRESNADDSDAVVAYNNLRVYVAADMFDIQALMTMARQRFRTWLKAHHTCHELPDILRELMLTVPPHCCDLRDSVMQFLAQHALAIVRINGMRSVLDEFGFLATGILGRAAAILQKQVKKLESQNADIRAERADFQHKLHQAQEARDTLRNSIDAERTRLTETVIGHLQHLSAGIKERYVCMNCGSPFNVDLGQIVHSYDQVVLRTSRQDARMALVCHMCGWGGRQISERTDYFMLRYGGR